MTPEELDALMDRYAGGEDGVFPTLYRALFPRLHGFLTRMAGGKRLADDLVQETFLRIHRARGTFTKGAAVVPWSYAIARNVFVDHTRRRGNLPMESLDDDNDRSGVLEGVTAGGPTPYGDLAAKRMLQTVEATLAKLPASQREAFILVRFEGLSMAEAAQVLDTTEASAKLRAFRAYEALRAALREGTQ